MRKTLYLSPSECTCPKCGGRNIQSISRITGYLTLDERFGPGKVAEKADRMNHNNEEHKQFYKEEDNNGIR